MDKKPLRRIGLSEADIEIYLAILKFGKANVTKLAEESGVHRTNIYSIIDKLKNMGLVSYFTEDNKRMCKVTDPENLLNYIKESEEAIQGILPDLTKIHDATADEVSVEIFRGEKGMKSAFKDIIRSKQNVVGWGMTGQLRKYLPVFSEQWIRDIKFYKIENKYIYVKGTQIKETQFKTKLLSKEYFTPVATQVYADKVLISIWEPTMLGILIRSKEVADNYKKHFNLLWKIAE